ncbi:unnamed protein product [Rangifer tarandus platyrhynchus]|uniref:Uncharacterized protein n=1 Tax=Rangifer tarandus platyrhynchus TaxID=3082113 RepID=A0AC59YGP4_RANTA
MRLPERGASPRRLGQKVQRRGPAGGGWKGREALRGRGEEFAGPRPGRSLQIFRASESLASDKSIVALNKCSLVSEHEKSAANREETRVDP